MPFQESEIIQFVLATGLLVFLYENRRQLLRLPAWPILIIGYGFYYLAITLTNLEALFWYKELNFIEHICYALCSAAVALWTLTVFRINREKA